MLERKHSEFLGITPITEVELYSQKIKYFINRSRQGFSYLPYLPKPPIQGAFLSPHPVSNKPFPRHSGQHLFLPEFKLPFV